MSEESLRKVLNTQSEFRERLRRRLELQSPHPGVDADLDGTRRDLDRLRERAAATDVARRQMVERYDRELARLHDAIAKQEGLLKARRTPPPQLQRPAVAPAPPVPTAPAAPRKAAVKAMPKAK